MENSKYFLVTQKALPEVLIKVVEVKQLLSLNKSISVKEATDKVGISRSSFYKYKDDISPFDDSAKGRTITMSLDILDKPGLLSDILHKVAECKANILTIHQSIPVGGVANISLSIEVLPDTGKLSDMVTEIELLDGILDAKILARE